jgi:UDP-GlcNAc:undecaprenyl-phosphate GlcNAc-1-phosphate transferase
MSADLAAILGTAFALAAVGTPVARRTALRLGLLDLPAARKLHARPVPLLGGVAVAAAVLASLLLHSERQALGELAGILAGAVWVSLWGLWDDRRALGPPAKLAAQVVGAAFLLFAGVSVDLPVPEPLNVALTLLWVVGVTNAFNLLDNMDGLAGGVGSVAAAFLLGLSAWNGQYLVGALAAAVLGACLGFLLHNLNPARIFLGDSGSLFLGFALAAVGIKLRFPANDPAVTWMVPVLAFGVPILDTGFVVAARLRAGRNPFTCPGQDHLSHRLLRLGWNCRQAVLVLCLAGAALGGAAVLVSLSGPFVAYATALSVGSLALAAMLRLSRAR